MDSLTRTTLQFDPAVSDSAITKAIEALHRVPGVLFTETSVGIRRALVAHDGGVTLATLIGAATGAGASVKVIVTSFSDATPAAATSYLTAWLSYGVFVISTGCIVLFALRIVSSSQLAFVAPVLLLLMLAETIVRRRRRS